MTMVGTLARDYLRMSEVDEKRWLGWMPVLFVLLWSTGFVAAKYGMPYAPPAGFLAWRFVLVLLLLLPLILWLQAPWPQSRAQLIHLAVVGVLMQAGYLGGCFGAINAGMSAGLTALIVGMQPILTALAAAPMLGERVSPRQWGGLVLGLGGTALVVANKIQVTGLTAAAIGFAVLGLVTITAGTIYQKRYAGHFDLRTGAFVQFAAAALVMIPFALAESRPVLWTPTLVASMSWLVVGLSIFTIGVLAILIRRGAATSVASLFYLVPPVTALLGFAMFDEALSGLAMVGMAVSVVGVALVVRPPVR